MEDDFNNLCIYDNLIKLDIKSFYGRVYTHNLDLNSDEMFITNLNLGRTNELILGNYVSLFVAECYLKKISDDLVKNFEEEKIDCNFSYFSDDFYFFCNVDNNDKIINIFDGVLEKYDLERNADKVIYWNYEEYSNYNLVEKYWKKIVAEDKIRYTINGKEKEGKRNFYFINQLIYRKANLKDAKLQKVFINNFFKSTYFNNLSWKKYELQDFNCHQILSMIKFSPEILLYIIPKFRIFDLFNEKMRIFLKVRYYESLKTNFYEEQLYYFYAIKTLKFDDILTISDNVELIIRSNNQILKSYYLLYKLFDEKTIIEFKSNENEDQWIFNYHLILYNLDLKHLEDNIKKYLVPKYALSNPSKVQNYLDFYKNNIINNISLIKNISEIENSIKRYLALKIIERKVLEESSEEALEILEDFNVDY